MLAEQSINTINSPENLIHLRQYKTFTNQQVLYSSDELDILKRCEKKKKVHNEFILLQPEFLPERLAENYIRKRYLSADDRKKHTVINSSGLYYSYDKTPLDGEYIYALLPNGRLFCAKTTEVTNHSHLVAGLPVIAAGHMLFKKGHLIILSNNSGHYKPKPIQMIEGLIHMQATSLNEFLFEDHSCCSSKGIRYFDINQVVRSSTFDTPLSSEVVGAFVKQKINMLRCNQGFANDGYDNEIFPLQNSSGYTENEGDVQEMLFRRNISRFNCKRREFKA